MSLEIEADSLEDVQKLVEDKEFTLQEKEYDVVDHQVLPEFYGVCDILELN